MDGGVGMELQLGGKVVFVAGSSRGIGRAIAATLLEEGARVVLTGRDPESLRRTHEELAAEHSREQVLAIAGDFADPETIEDAFNVAVSRFGRMDHLVANLGTGSGKPGWRQDEAEWIRLFDANFFASVRLAQATVPHLRGRDGSILFVSSIVALESTAAPLAYSAAKAALNNYAKNLARLLAPERIRVNTICPGNIFFAGGSWERHLANRREAVEQMLRTEVPLGRFGTPEEIASLAAYLLSGQAGCATGATYVMGGGESVQDRALR